jgi:hypothetical protein
VFSETSAIAAISATQQVMMAMAWVFGAVAFGLSALPRALL